MKLIIAIFILTLTLNADIENGKDVYAQNCGNCHRTDMKGGMGEDFNIVSYNRKVEDVAKYVANPAQMYEQFGYAANAMPKIPLSEQQIKDVSEYIDSLQKFKKWMAK